MDILELLELYADSVEDIDYLYMLPLSIYDFRVGAVKI